LPDPRDFHTPQPSYSKEDLLRSSEGGYFGPGNAQLPAPPMLMMDRITELSVDGGEFGKGHVVAELDIKPGLWFFGCNFPGDPVMPASLSRPASTNAASSEAREMNLGRQRWHCAKAASMFRPAASEITS